MNTNTQTTQKTDCEQHYARHISRNKTSTPKLSETFHERKNHLAKEAHAHCTINETVKDTEQRQSVQRRTYAHQYEKESAKQTKM
ncbi:32232_t:CDS:2 [Gigaspora margarita]|uniref:32232_t:CDS:1 n=1 Tax=Gigaspora margarita TaxID=4874 RepID=A0ABN7VKM8_GIGMA|nr:32232_t:CDS:2 [Gigaspora margarita]